MMATGARFCALFIAGTIALSSLALARPGIGIAENNDAVCQNGMGATLLPADAAGKDGQALGRAVTQSGGLRDTGETTAGWATGAPIALVHARQHEKAAQDKRPRASTARQQCDMGNAGSGKDLMAKRPAGAVCLAAAGAASTVAYGSSTAVGGPFRIKCSDGRTFTSPFQYGVYVPSGPAELARYEQWLGHEVQVASSFLYYQAGWDRLVRSGGPVRWGRWVSESPDRWLSIAVPLTPDTEGRAGLEKCARGEANEYWAQLARRLHNSNVARAYFRLGWEMDGKWFKWSSIGREATFAQCFREVVTVFRDYAAANYPEAQWLMVWNPTGHPSSATNKVLSTAWPGDEYVDVVGVDLYDTKGWSTVVKWLNRMRNFAARHDKPIAFPEWGAWAGPRCCGAGFDRTEYVEGMWKWMNDPNNNVLYQAYFEVNWRGAYHKLFEKTRHPLTAVRYRELFGCR